MKVLAAMSGGVDSSVAAALLLDAGHEVVGVTLKLWGGEGDSGCCSVADVDDARRVCQQLGIDHHVFGFGDVFSERVVDPYVGAHRAGRTPNPCIECNRHVKFDALLARAELLGFDALATGHHARVTRSGAGRWELRRGVDAAKDQSYVLYMLGQEVLARCLLPVGGMTKAEVRARAAALGLRTAAKGDSQDVCFITSTAGRAGFLGPRLPFTPGRIVDTGGREVGQVEAVELVTIGQRKGLGLGGDGNRRYVVDVAGATVVVGDHAALLRPAVELRDVCWVDGPVAGPVLAQVSAHGAVAPAAIDGSTVRWEAPQRRVAPGQSVVLYAPAEPDRVVGGAIAC